MSVRGVIEGGYVIDGECEGGHLFCEDGCRGQSHQAVLGQVDDDMSGGKGRGDVVGLGTRHRRVKRARLVGVWVKRARLVGVWVKKAG